MELEEVIINGVKYIPEGSTVNESLRVGVSISSFNRPQQLLKTVEEWCKYTPEQFPIVVVDDCSTEPLPSLPERVIVYKMEQNSGIAKVKNKSIELLEDLKVQHMFLSDNDFYPVIDNWWLPYCDSSEPHLMYQFFDFSKPPLMKTNSVIYEDSELKAYAESRGCMLYIDANKILPTVGGLDEAFGRFSYEHTEWSDRMNSAGLTRFRYADVQGSEQLFHSMDEHHEVERTLATQERKELVKRNEQIWLKHFKAGRTGWLPYRSRKEVEKTAVVGALYNSHTDLQRSGQRMSLEQTEAWRKSVKQVSPATEVMLFIDNEDARTLEGGKTINVKPYWEVYWDRFVQALKLLEARTDIDKVFLTDTTDVIMLEEPWQYLKQGTLYVGYEPSVLKENKWIQKQTKHNQHAINISAPVFNCGVIGGYRTTVIEFLKDFIRYKTTYEHLVHMKEAEAGEIFEMPAFNILLNSDKWKDRIEYGPHITTLFKHEETNSKAWWKHK